MTPPAVPMRSFRSSLPMALLRAREAVMNEFRPGLADYGLNEQQWRVLRALSNSDDPLSVGELADRTLLLGPSLSRILIRLDEKGWIKRKTDRTDARRAFISITRAGTTLVRKVAPHSEETYAAIESRFGTARLANLIKELHDLADTEAAATQAAGGEAR